nr:hypothetical protein Itr_chr06CG24160 [Ipomoea trifida]
MAVNHEKTVVTLQSVNRARTQTDELPGQAWVTGQVHLRPPVALLLCMCVCENSGPPRLQANRLRHARSFACSLLKQRSRGRFCERIVSK